MPGHANATNPRGSIAPSFIVNDVVATASFYLDKLGFPYETFWGEQPRFSIVGRGGVAIMLRQLEKSGFMHPSRTPDPEDFVRDAYVRVENVDALSRNSRMGALRLPGKSATRNTGPASLTLQTLMATAFALARTFHA